MNIIGKVEGKTCILIDDMIDTAGTICHAADALAEAGAVEVYASCTHPVLSGPAMDNIQKSAIKKLVVLDTIYLPEERLIDKIEQISIAHLLGDAIVRIHEKRPLSPLSVLRKRFKFSLRIKHTPSRSELLGAFCSQNLQAFSNCAILMKKEDFYESRIYQSK